MLTAMATAFHDDGSVETFLTVQMHAERRELAERADVARDDRPAAQAAFDDAATEAFFLRMHPNDIARKILRDQVLQGEPRQNRDAALDLGR